MSELTFKTSQQASPDTEQLTVPVLDAQIDANASTARGKIPLTVRSRMKVTRVSPPIDDGFRPFRVF